MLHRLLPWRGHAYNNAQLAFRARITLAEDPQLADITLVSITSVNGVIQLKGCVPHANDKAHIEGVIRNALHTAGLPYARLVNALQARAVPCAQTTPASTNGQAGSYRHLPVRPELDRSLAST